MGLSTQERQSLEAEFSKKVVDEAQAFAQHLDQTGGRNREPTLTKEQYRVLIQLRFT